LPPINANDNSSNPWRINETTNNGPDLSQRFWRVVAIVGVSDSTAVMENRSENPLRNWQVTASPVFSENPGW
jgi:hypothetical protein